MTKRLPKALQGLPIALETRSAVPSLKTEKKSTRGKSLGVNEKLMRVRIRALEIPPIKDGLVIGKGAAIGGEAMARTLRLMTNEKFERILVRDDVVQEIIARSAIVKKVGAEQLQAFVKNRIKPLMTESELLLLDIEIELVVEDLL